MTSTECFLRSKVKEMLKDCLIHFQYVNRTTKAVFLATRDTYCTWLCSSEGQIIAGSTNSSDLCSMLENVNCCYGNRYAFFIIFLLYKIDKWWAIKIVKKQQQISTASCVFPFLAVLQPLLNTVPPLISLNPETHAMSQKDRILGQNPYQKWLIQEKIAQFTGDKNSESTVPLYHTPKALTLKLRRCHKKTEFLAKILSKQGLYKKKACIFQILTMLNPQYLLTKYITMNLSQ